MATMSMFDVLPSAEFIDQASYIRTIRTIDTHGRGVDTAGAAVAFMAVVMPEGSSLDRLPDGSRLSGSIRIWSQTYLCDGLKIDDTGAVQPDIVLWHGRQYVVRAVQDWDAFAGMGGLGVGISFGPGITPVAGSTKGFFVASADLLPLNPTSGV
jgi:hypothetical protein